MDKLIIPARLIYAGAIAALGVENLICAHVSQSIFAKNPPAVPVLPFVPAIPALAYLAGLVFLATGLTIAANFQPRRAAIFLGFFLFLCVVVVLLPQAVRSLRDLNLRTCVFEELALGASAFTLAACLRKQESSRTHGSSFIGILTVSAPYLFAASSIVFGTTHFLVLPFIATLVPAWIPGGLFWAYFTGAGFIAAGISIATGVLARWGAFWLGIMFLLWFLVLHSPRVAMHPNLPAEWSSAFIALAMCGGSWILAANATQTREGCR